ncbi:MAG: hypothetical protein ACM3MI_02630 [Clostridiales bacterium]
MTTIEKQITKGYVTYIHSFSYDDVKRQFQMNLFYDPDLHTVVKLAVTFNDIMDFYLNEDEVEDDCLDQIIGIDEYPEGDFVNYVIRTDQREFIFRTQTTPVIV